MEHDDHQKSLDNVEAQMRKGVLEYAILLVIAKKKTYATEIIQNLQKARLVVVEGTIYPLLSRLKNAGLLDYFWEESKAGPPRKYYSLTLRGQAFLAHYDKQWSALNRSIKHLKNI